MSLSILITVVTICVFGIPQISSKNLQLDPESLYDAASLPADLVTKHLVSTEVDILDVLDYYNETFADLEAGRRFKQLVLGYVTPWNNKGYNRAVKYAKKFTHIAPVWLQILPKGKSKSEFLVQGTHDIDIGWIQRIKSVNDKIKIVPRFLLENFDGESFFGLIYDSDKALAFASTISSVLKKHGFDGSVLEMWKPLKEDVDRRALRHTIKTIAGHLKKDNFETILVVQPSGGQTSPGIFRAEDFKVLAESVTAFSVMTYDHPLAYSSAGAIAPLGWVYDSLASLSTEKEKSSRKKLLLGLNHYGYDFTSNKGAEAITASTFLSHLEMYHPKLEWDAEAREHFYVYTDGIVNHKVHFPTMKALDERITLAKLLGSGIAIWDLGQGLEYFFDLL